LRRVFVLESRVDIADEVVIVIVADHNFFDLSVFAHLAPEVLIKSIEVVLQLRGIHFVFLIVCWVLV
jgi:hypothetical protein